MYGEYAEKRSRASLILTRLGISLAAGALLTFIVPSVMNGLWPYFQNSHFQPHPLAILVEKALNLPAVLFCHFGKLPPALPRSDESLYCWSVGFLFNIPYYAVVVFLFWSLGLKLFSGTKAVQFRSEI